MITFGKTGNVREGTGQLTWKRQGSAREKFCGGKLLVINLSFSILFYGFFCLLNRREHFYRTFADINNVLIALAITYMHDVVM